MENVDAKAGYYETWRAIANQQAQGSYLQSRLRQLADSMQQTDQEVVGEQKKGEQNFRTYIKSLYLYAKAASDYVQLVKDLDETVSECCARARLLLHMRVCMI